MARFSTFLTLVLLMPGFAQAQASEFTAFDSYLGGVTHTMFGLDHVIAMIAVGLISSQFGTRAVWQIPLIFVISLVIGGATGMLLPEGDFRDWVLSSSEAIIMVSDILLVVAVVWISQNKTALRAFWTVFALLSVFVVVQLLQNAGINIDPLWARIAALVAVILANVLMSASKDAYAGAMAMMFGFVIIFGLFHGFAHGGEVEDKIPTFYVLGFATTSIIMHIIGVGIGESARLSAQPRVFRGVFAAVLVGISIPYQVNFWNSIMPDFLLLLFEF